jgi:pimeloyl-ACP methyl ester carboxylesterase
MLKHHYVDLNGVRLHYAAIGQGPLILFLHGFPEFWYEWRNLLPEFGKDHLAVAPDMRGFNVSSKPSVLEQYRMKHLVEDVRALAGHLGHQKFVLVGHDWGGAVAWAFAISHPECLEKLVIVNAPHPGVFARELQHNPGQQKASQYMLMFRTPQAEEKLAANNYRWLLNAFGLDGALLSKEEQQAYIEAWSQPGSLTGGLNYYRAHRAGPPDSRFEESSGNFAVDPARLTVNVPTLVVCGEKDTALLTGNLDGLSEFVPQLTVKRIPDGTHWVIHEKPADVAHLIREFLR